MKHHIIPVTAFGQNCSVIYCPQTQQAAVVDPGGEAEKIVGQVSALGVTVTQVLLTHGHLDHVGAAVAIAEHYQVPIVGPHKDDAFLLESLPQQAQMFGLEDCAAFTPDTWLKEGTWSRLAKKACQCSNVRAIRRVISCLSTMRHNLPFQVM